VSSEEPRISIEDIPIPPYQGYIGRDGKLVPAEPGAAADEWDGADSDAHQARVEAGEITQAGEAREPGMDEWGQPEAGG
jgi:hypothetical protein